MEKINQSLGGNEGHPMESEVDEFSKKLPLLKDYYYLIISYKSTRERDLDLEKSVGSAIKASLYYKCKDVLTQDDIDYLEKKYVQEYIDLTNKIISHNTK